MTFQRLLSLLHLIFKYKFSVLYNRQAERKQKDNYVYLSKLRISEPGQCCSLLLLSIDGTKNQFLLFSILWFISLTSFTHFKNFVITLCIHFYL